ncbi:type II secretion system protein F [Vibrio cholerae]|jgi:tight adherence protein B|nr:type II secretion system protein F [Vibrio cholerae]
MILLVATVFILTSVGLLFGVAFRSRPALPHDRRRPSEAAGASSVTRFADGATGVVEIFLARHPLRLFPREALELAGFASTQPQFLVLILSLSLGAFALGSLVANVALGALFFLLVPLGGHLAITRATATRRKKFDIQLPDTLQLLTGSLRAGHSILRAIDAAAVESASPTSEEMHRVVSETSLGKDLLLSLNDIAARMRNEDFIWISQAIQINREVGGNLAEVLDQVNETIRERSEIKGQIKALAAEGKFSAYILVAMPFGIIALLMLISPGYMTPMFTTFLGWVMMGFAGVLIIIGSLWMRKIIDLKF